MMNQKSNEQLQCIAISCLQAVSLLVPSLSPGASLSLLLLRCCVVRWSSASFSRQSRVRQRARSRCPHQMQPGCIHTCLASPLVGLAQGQMHHRDRVR
jgi:hypothetical protein